MSCGEMKYNNQIHLTVKSVTSFAVAKVPPLFTSSDLGVRNRIEMEKKRKPIPLFSSDKQKRTTFNKAKFNQFMNGEFKTLERNMGYSFKKHIVPSVVMAFLFGGIACFYALVSEVILSGRLFFLAIGLVFGGLLGFIEEFWNMGRAYTQLIMMLLMAFMLVPSLYFSNFMGWTNVNW